MADKTFNDVQLFVTFTPEIDGASKQPASVLYSNLDPTGATNMAIELAKIYSWASDMLVFNPTATGTTPKVTIDPDVLPDIDTTYTFAEGSTDGAFTVTEEGSAAQTISVHNAATKAADGLVKEAQLPKYRVVKVDNAQVSGTSDRFKLQICRNWSAAAASQTWTDVSDINLGLFATSASGDDEIGKIKSALLPSYVDDIVEGYFYNNAWYSDSAHTDRIYGQSDKIYVDLATDKSYRCSPSGTPGQSGYSETWVDISNPISAEEIYSLCGMPSGGNFNTTKHGLVPAASGTGDTGKFLRGDGTWAALPAAVTYELSGTTYGTSNATQIVTLTPSSGTATTAEIKAMVGATSSAAGKAGLVPVAPTSGYNTKFLRADGTWVVPTNTTYSMSTGTTYGSSDTVQTITLTPSSGTAQTATIAAMVGANGTTAGKAGLVPKPAATDNTKFLTGAGTWATPANTTYALSGAYGSGNKTWVSTLTANGSTAAGTSTVPTASTTVYGITSLSSATDSTAEDVAATPKAVKLAYDLANGKSTVSVSNLKSSGTKIATITVNGTGKDVYVENMTASTASAAGVRGTVQPPANSMDKYLRGDNTWVEPVEDFRSKVNDETYTLVLHCTNGRT